mmetsp:Transcript_94242/g.272310  ORF Transcript_94242/g.272310 Transcript_94242/m.272310 type:complete len:232 (+) Transcript_94242:679-1374(+)
MWARDIGAHPPCGVDLHPHCSDAGPGAGEVGHPWVATQHVRRYCPGSRWPRCGVLHGAHRDCRSDDVRRWQLHRSRAHCERLGRLAGLQNGCGGQHVVDHPSLQHPGQDLLVRHSRIHVVALHGLRRSAGLRVRLAGMGRRLRGLEPGRATAGRLLDAHLRRRLPPCAAQRLQRRGLAGGLRPRHRERLVHLGGVRLGLRVGGLVHVRGVSPGHRYQEHRAGLAGRAVARG